VILNVKKFKINISQGKILKILKESEKYKSITFQPLCSTETFTAVHQLLDEPLVLLIKAAGKCY